MDTLKLVCGICVHIFHRLFNQSTVCSVFPDIGTAVCHDHDKVCRHTAQRAHLYLNYYYHYHALKSDVNGTVLSLATRIIPFKSIESYSANQRLQGIFHICLLRGKMIFSPLSPL